MQKKKMYMMMAALTLCASMCCVGVFAKTRSGQAAYHLHTSKMVTAARYEPRGSVLLVTNPENGKSVKVTVNDRGPWNGNRILDLSTGAFKKLYGSLRRGVGPVKYKVLKRGKG